VFAASEGTEDKFTRSSVVRLQFAGANREVTVEGEEPLPGAANFFLGNDPQQWQTNVPTYAAIIYHDLYPGIDLIYSGKQGRLKSEFVVAAGADPTAITMEYSGASSMSVRDDGALVLETPIGKLIEAPPHIYQMVDDERVTVEGRYVLLGEREVAFALGDYVSTKTLIIDPTLQWNTFLGSANADAGKGITVDTSGNVYVTGYSNSSWGSPLNPHAGYTDVFVAKLSSAGQLEWNTFLGSVAYDYGQGVAVDSSGNVYVTGYSNSSWGSPLNPYAGYSDVFVAKLSSAGQLEWNTFLGSEDSDCVYDIAIANEDLYVVGYSSASWGTPLSGHTGGDDAFVAKLTSSGALQWNTFLGGAGDDFGLGVAVDGSGCPYVTGKSGNWGSPVNPHAGYPDAFVAKLADNGAVLWNTFLGSVGENGGWGITVVGNGVCVVGRSDGGWGSPLSPHTGDGNMDAFVAKVDSTGNLLWNTFLGSHGLDWATGVVSDDSGNITLIGRSEGSWGSPLIPHAGWTDVFIAELGSNGNLQWNTFLGSEYNDWGEGVVSDLGGNIYLVGLSAAGWGSPLSPHTGDGDWDAFVAKIGEGGTTTIYVPDDYPTIQAAVDAANPNDTIIVRNGTYVENRT